MSIDYARTDKAAAEVSPLMLASALDHIAKTASRSRSMSRRIRWIQARAELALSGRPYIAEENELPKGSGPNTPEKLRVKADFYRRQCRELLEALTLIASTDSVDASLDPGRAIRIATAAITKACGERVDVVSA